MHDIFSLPPGGYPQDLLSLRSEIISRTLAGHIDSAYEMYQFELEQLRERGIRVFDLPREHFELEHRLSQLDYAQHSTEMDGIIARMDQLKLAAGFPQERVDDPMGQGKPAELLELEAQMQHAAERADMAESLRISTQWLERMRYYGYPQPGMEQQEQAYQEFLEQEEELQRQVPPEYLATMRALAMALYRGDMDEVLLQHEQQIRIAESLGINIQRMTREYFELQHRISKAARRNDQAQLAELQQELEELQPADQQVMELFVDPSGVMGLPPEYADLARECAEAFERGDEAEAIRISQQMQKLLESSGNIYNIMNIIDGEAGA
ncbi:hypothetical protein KDL44_11260 [bacterium]|nr:hypothetical protein [bacterium]